MRISIHIYIYIYTYIYIYIHTYIDPAVREGEAEEHLEHEAACRLGGSGVQHE